jgi:hypothetical protein
MDLLLNGYIIFKNRKPFIVLCDEGFSIWKKRIVFKVKG